MKNNLLVAIFLSLVVFLLASCSGGTSTSINPNSNPDTNPASSNKSIVSYSLNGHLGVVGEDDINVIVPAGTSVTSLVATFAINGGTVTVGATPEISGQTANDFSNPVVYTVTAEDGTTQDYTVTVMVASISDKDILYYSINGNDGVITSNNINIVVAYGTNVTSLIATFITNSETVTVGATPQISSQTANDFSNPVVYTVTAEDGTTQNYTVTVTVAGSSDNAILEFSLDNIQGTIIGNNISVTVPYGTDVTQLTTAFTTNGQKVFIGTVEQVSNVSVNNFTKPVVFRVTAADGSTQNYTATVTVAQSSAKAILHYSIDGNDGIIIGNNILVEVPNGTNVNSLAATFIISGQQLQVDGAKQASGITENNFTDPVTYTVVAADGTDEDYFVTVIETPNSEASIIAFSLNGYQGTIIGNTINVAVPYGTPVNAMVATFIINGTKLTVGNVQQVYARTENDFTAPVTYTVTAADGVTTQNYKVTVVISDNTYNAITDFSLNGFQGVISGLNITVTVPYGTPVKSLIATFITNGASVQVGTALQTSGQTANDFTKPVNYKVTAAKGATRTYIVTVIVSNSAYNAITLFSLDGYQGDINGNLINVIVPSGTPTNAMRATFVPTGENITVNGIPQVYGITENNFTNSINNPVVYTVTAANGAIQNYMVSVTVSSNSAKAVTFYSLNGTVGTINGNNISVNMPSGTDVTQLIATFATSGASVKIGNITQISGLTTNDFSGSNNPVVYTITAADGTTQNYNVTVTTQ